MSDRAKLIQFYIAFYNRAPDPEGLAFWQSACDAGLSLNAIADLFVPQAETLAVYPFLANPTEEGVRTFLQAVYQNLFNRELDDAGETFWTTQILQSDAFTGEDTGNGLSLGEVVVSIIMGAQGDDITTLANKTEVALDFHDQAADTEGFAQTQEASTASRLALSVVDETDFSVIQGKVLNENFFEVDDVPTPGITPGDFTFVIPPGDDMTQELQVNGGMFIEGNQLNPRVAVLTDGTIAVTYDNNTTMTINPIVIQLFSTSGTFEKTGTFEVPLDDFFGTVTSQRSADIVALPNGEFAIAIQFVGDGTQTLGVLRMNQDGEVIDDPVFLTSTLAFAFFEVDMSRGDDGKLYVSYRMSPDDVAGSPNGIFMSVIELDDSAVAENVRVNEDTLGQQINGKIATLPDGTSLVVYEDGNAIPAVGNLQGSVFGRIIGPEGDPDSDQFLIPGFPEDRQLRPNVATLGDDKFVVTFSTESDQFELGTGISAIILDKEGDVEIEEFPVNAVNGALDFNPVVVELSNGNIVFVWQSGVRGGFDIFAAIYDSEGELVRSDFQINQAAFGNQINPQVDAAGNGFVVTWQTEAPTGNDLHPASVRIALFDNSGAPIDLPGKDDELIPYEPGAFDPVVGANDKTIFEFPGNGEIPGDQMGEGHAVLSDGRIAVIYSDQLDPSSNQVFVRIYEANGQLLQDDFRVLKDAEAIVGNSAKSPAIAALPNGEFVVVTTFADVAGNDQQIRAYHYDTSGTLLNVSTVSDVPPDPSFGNLSVTYLPTGQIALTYVGQDGDQNTPSDGVFVRLIDLDGNDDTPSVAVNDDSDGPQTNPAVASLIDGTTLIAFQAEDSSNDDGIFVRLVGPEGTPDGNNVEFEIATNNALNQRNPSVAALDKDHFVVVFETLSGEFDMDGFGVSGVVINRDGTITVPEFPINSSMDFGQSNPAVATLADGNFIVVFENEAPDNSSTFDNISARIFAPDGTPQSGEFIVNVNEDGIQSNPSVSVSSDGFVISWTSPDGNPEDPFGTSVRLAAFETDGTRIELPVDPDTLTPALTQRDLTVNTTSEDPQVDPRVTELANGNIVIIWTSFSDGNLYFKIVDPEDTVVVNEQRVFDTIQPSRSTYDIDALPNGGFVVAMNAADPTNQGGEGLWQRIFTEDGAGGFPMAVDTGNGEVENVHVSASSFNSGTHSIAYTQNNGVSVMSLFDSNSGTQTVTSSVGLTNASVQGVALNDQGQSVLLINQFVFFNNGPAETLSSVAYGPSLVPPYFQPVIFEEQDP